MKCRMVLLIAGLMVATVSAKAQDISTFDAISREELFTTSRDSSSQTEKVIIRSYLAKKYPQTAEGLTSKAWLADYEGRSEESLALYKECVAQYPDFLAALNNLAVQLKGKEKIEVFKRMMQRDPSFLNYAAIRGTYFTYVDGLKDKPAGDAFLAEWEQKLPGNYIFDFIRGVYAQENEKDYQKAEQYFLKAIEKGTTNFAVYRTLTNLRFDELSNNKTDFSVRLGYLKLITDYFLKNPKSDEALIYLGDKFYYTFKGYREAFGMYQRAFEVKPTAEAATSAFDSARQSSLDDAERFLLEANSKLRNNELILRTLGYLYSNLLNDKDRAEDFYKQAIKFSYTTKDEAANATQLAINVYQGITFEFDRAEQIYLSYLDRVSDKSNLLSQLFYNRRNAQDFNAALKYLDEYEKYVRAQKSIDETWFLDRRKELDLYLSAEERSSNYYKDNPFLRVWRGRFGEAFQQSVYFGLNSAVIPPSEQQRLAQIATLMLEKGAEKYVFSVDGYGDRGEADVERLSQRRADAVVRLLNEVHSVPLSRMRAVGKGLGFTADIKARRYVEVFPLGNTANPSILTTGALKTDTNLAVSPDGNMLATGNSPIQIWDAQKQIKLKDLGRGGAARAFSPDGRYLATASNYTEIGGEISTALLVYDVRSGLLVAQVPWSNEIDYLDWSPDSSRIVLTTSTYNKIVIYDVEHRKLLKSVISPGRAFNGGDKIVWTKDGKYIVAGRPQANILHVYDANSLAPVRTLEGVSWAHAVGSTSDGKYLLCADNKRTLSVWDTRTFALKQVHIPVAANSLVVHPDKPLVAINDFGGVEHNKVILVDVANMQVLAEHDVGRDDDVEIGFSARGDKLYVARKDRIEILDGTTLNEISSFTGTAFSPRGGASDQQHNYYVSYDAQGVNVWNILTGRKVHTWNVGVEKLARLPNEPSRFIGLVADEAAQETYVRLFDTATFQQTDLLKLDFKAETWTSNAQVIAFAGAPFMPLDSGSEQGVIEVYDRKSLALKSKTPLLLVLAYLEYGTLDNSGIDSFDVNETGTEAVVTSYWQDGFGHSASYAKEARVVNLADGKVLHSFKIGAEVRQVHYDPDQQDHIHVLTRGSTYVYDRRTWDYVPGEFNLRAYEHDIRLKGGQADVRWGDDYLRYSDKKTGTSKQIVFKEDLINVEAFEDQNLLVTIGNSNEISFFDLSRLEKVLSIVSKKDSEWIAYTPSGEFASSINGTDKVFWLVGDQSLEFAALKSRFERPNILAERLEGIFHRQSDAAARAPALDAELFVVPYSITVLSPKQTETSASTYKLQVRVQKSKPDLPDPVLEYTQQFRRLEDSRGAALVVGKPDVIEREFKLADGPNLIQVSINYKNATLATQSVLVTRTPGARPAAPLNDLWFLGVGVSRYQNGAFDLQFADKDVEFVADLLKKQEGKLYRKVNTRLLLNQDATIPNVKAGMYEFLKNASDLDVVVIFIAGHGTQDSDQSLYFMTYESDLNKPFTGIDLLDFQKFLKRRPENQKAIVCMDICHAGSYRGSRENNARGGLTVEEAVKQLAEGTGLVVLASSTGRESALESSDYGGGHGAFTAAMLEGLSGQADMDDNGYISMAELQAYVSRRVPDITKGQQHPTFPLIEQLRDFPFVARLAGR
jgi:WD40 repeat protein/outer membrane protein OmpA-like peptidoglycan-associated protein